jgi:aspartyl protease family protein
MLVPGIPVPGPTPGSVLVAKSRDGHFHVRAKIDGHAIQLIVDTGASSVVLTDRDARAIGIRPREDEYTVATSTANGRASTAPVILSDLTIGSISQKNVPALVAQPGALDTSLLGNSFLERLHSFTFEGGKLMLKR